MDINEIARHPKNPTGLRVKGLSRILQDPAVVSVHREVDGCFHPTRPSYWVYLADGWWSPDTECGTIHEPTLAAVYDALSGVIRLTE